MPGWSKAAPKVKPINARDDTIATSGLFRTSFKKGRCLVPADGYYEWRAEGKHKQPYLFEVDEGGLFAFAGIWDAWRETPEADPLFTFATITTTPNALAATVHNRMPVILPTAVWDKWLDPDLTDADELLALLKPIPEDGMSVRPVNPAMGSSKFQWPACLTPSAALFADAVGGAVGPFPR